APNQAGSPSPGATYLGAPNSSAVSQVNAYDGTNSCRLQWQWQDANHNARWATVLASGATSGKTYPQLDTHQPITVRYLVLPVGTSVGNVFNGTVSAIAKTPATASTTSSNTLSVTVTGAGSYTYQWGFNGGPIGGATDSAYVAGYPAGLNNPGDSGTYSV